MRAFWAAVLALLLYVGPAHAGIQAVVDKPLDPTWYGLTSSYADQNIAEDFVLRAPVRVTEVRWYGLFSSGVTATSQSVADFDILFFADDPSTRVVTYGGVVVTGLPAARPFHRATVRGVTGVATTFPDMLHGGTIFEWRAPLAGPVMGPGRYWIVVRSASTEPDYFLWSHSSPGDGVAVFRTLADTFTRCPSHPSNCWQVADEFGDTQALTILGAVPPGSAKVPMRPLEGSPSGPAASARPCAAAAPSRARSGCAF